MHKRFTAIVRKMALDKRVPLCYNKKNVPKEGKICAKN